MPHDVPTAAELVEAVREWMVAAVGQDAPASPFGVRVASNMLAIVERELLIGAEHEERHRRRLAMLGVADDAELATEIRSGLFDDRVDEVRSLVRDSVCDKLAVANPRYLDRPPEMPEPDSGARPIVTG